MVVRSSDVDQGVIGTRIVFTIVPLDKDGIAYPLMRLNSHRSFITEICYDQAEAAIVKAVIFLAAKLKLYMIAEGVETLEQRDF